jgi:hypothetical protein
MLCLVVLGCSCPQIQEIARQVENNSTNASNTSTPATDSTPATSNLKLTPAKYNQLKDGMSYKEVSEILGSEGVEQMSSGKGDFKVTSYKWEESDLKWATVVFMGDKLTSKVQYGIK